MKYYNAQDIMEITGAKPNKAYEIIRNLNKKYKKKFPDCELLQGKVAKWWFLEAMGLKDEKDSDHNEAKEIS